MVLAHAIRVNHGKGATGPKSWRSRTQSGPIWAGRSGKFAILPWEKRHPAEKSALTHAIRAPRERRSRSRTRSGGGRATILDRGGADRGGAAGVAIRCTIMVFRRLWASKVTCLSTSASRLRHIVVVIYIYGKPITLPPGIWRGSEHHLRYCWSRSGGSEETSNGSIKHVTFATRGLTFSILSYRMAGNGGLARERCKTPPTGVVGRQEPQA